jgi:hypothetical protein
MSLIDRRSILCDVEILCGSLKVGHVGCRRIMAEDASKIYLFWSTRKLLCQCEVRSKGNLGDRGHSKRPFSLTMSCIVRKGNQSSLNSCRTLFGFLFDVDRDIATRSRDPSSCSIHFCPHCVRRPPIRNRLLSWGDHLNHCNTHRKS